MICFILFSIELLWPQKTSKEHSDIKLVLSFTKKKKKILLLMKNKNIGIKNDSGKIRAFFSLLYNFVFLNRFGDVLS
jgi:hypothetical protein